MTNYDGKTIEEVMEMEKLEYVENTNPLRPEELKDPNRVIKIELLGIIAAYQEPVGSKQICRDYEEMNGGAPLEPRDHGFKDFTSMMRTFSDKFDCHGDGIKMTYSAKTTERSAHLQELIKNQTTAEERRVREMRRSRSHGRYGRMTNYGAGIYFSQKIAPLLNDDRTEEERIADNRMPLRRWLAERAQNRDANWGDNIMPFRRWLAGAEGAQNRDANWGGMMSGGGGEKEAIARSRSVPPPLPPRPTFRGWEGMNDFSGECTDPSRVQNKPKSPGVSPAGKRMLGFSLAAADSNNNRMRGTRERVLMERQAASEKRNGEMARDSNGDPTMSNENEEDWTVVPAPPSFLKAQAAAADRAFSVGTSSQSVPPPIPAPRPSLLPSATASPSSSPAAVAPSAFGGLKSSWPPSISARPVAESEKREKKRTELIDGREMREEVSRTPSGSWTTMSEREEIEKKIAKLVAEATIDLVRRLQSGETIFMHDVVNSHTERIIRNNSNLFVVDEDNDIVCLHKDVHPKLLMIDGRMMGEGEEKKKIEAPRKEGAAGVFWPPFSKTKPVDEREQRGSLTTESEKREEKMDEATIDLVRRLHSGDIKARLMRFITGTPLEAIVRKNPDLFVVDEEGEAILLLHKDVHPELLLMGEEKKKTGAPRSEGRAGVFSRPSRPESCHQAREIRRFGAVAAPAAAAATPLRSRSHRSTQQQPSETSDADSGTQDVLAWTHRRGTDSGVAARNGELKDSLSGSSTHSSLENLVLEIPKEILDGEDEDDVVEDEPAAPWCAFPEHRDIRYLGEKAALVFDEIRKGKIYLGSVLTSFAPNRLLLTLCEEKMEERLQMIMRKLSPAYVDASPLNEVRLGQFAVAIKDDLIVRVVVLRAIPDEASTFECACLDYNALINVHSSSLFPLLDRFGVHSLRAVTFFANLNGVPNLNPSGHRAVRKVAKGVEEDENVKRRQPFIFHGQNKRTGALVVDVAIMMAGDCDWMGEGFPRMMGSTRRVDARINPGIKHAVEYAWENGLVDYEMKEEEEERKENVREIENNQVREMRPVGAVAAAAPRPRVQQPWKNWDSSVDDCSHSPQWRDFAFTDILKLGWLPILERIGKGKIILGSVLTSFAPNRLLLTFCEQKMMERLQMIMRAMSPAYVDAPPLNRPVQLGQFGVAIDGDLIVRVVVLRPDDYEEDTFECACLDYNSLVKVHSSALYPLIDRFSVFQLPSLTFVATLNGVKDLDLYGNRAVRVMTKRVAGEEKRRQPIIVHGMDKSDLVVDVAIMMADECHWMGEAFPRMMGLSTGPNAHPNPDIQHAVAFALAVGLVDYEMKEEEREEKEEERKESVAVEEIENNQPRDVMPSLEKTKSCDVQRTDSGLSNWSEEEEPEKVREMRPVGAGAAAAAAAAAPRPSVQQQQPCDSSDDDTTHSSTIQWSDFHDLTDIRKLDDKEALEGIHKGQILLGSVLTSFAPNRLLLTFCDEKMEERLKMIMIELCPAYMGASPLNNAVRLGQFAVAINATDEGLVLFRVVVLRWVPDDAKGFLYECACLDFPLIINAYPSALFRLLDRFSLSHMPSSTFVATLNGVKDLRGSGHRAVKELRKSEEGVTRCQPFIVHGKDDERCSHSFKGWAKKEELVVDVAIMMAGECQWMGEAFPRMMGSTTRPNAHPNPDIKEAVAYARAVGLVDYDMKEEERKEEEEVEERKESVAVEEIENNQSRDVMPSLEETKSFEVQRTDSGLSNNWTEEKEPEKWCAVPDHTDIRMLGRKSVLAFQEIRQYQILLGSVLTSFAPNRLLITFCEENMEERLQMIMRELSPAYEYASPLNEIRLGQFAVAIKDDLIVRVVVLSEVRDEEDTFECACLDYNALFNVHSSSLFPLLDRFAVHNLRPITFLFPLIGVPDLCVSGHRAVRVMTKGVDGDENVKRRQPVVFHEYMVDVAIMMADDCHWMSEAFPRMMGSTGRQVDSRNPDIKHAVAYAQQRGLVGYEMKEKEEGREESVAVEEMEEDQDVEQMPSLAPTMTLVEEEEQKEEEGEQWESLNAEGEMNQEHGEATTTERIAVDKHAAGDFAREEEELHDEVVFVKAPAKPILDVKSLTSIVRTLKEKNQHVRAEAVKAACTALVSTVNEVLSTLGQDGEAIRANFDALNAIDQA